MLRPFSGVCIDTEGTHVAIPLSFARGGEGAWQTEYTCHSPRKAGQDDGNVCARNPFKMTVLKLARSTGRHAQTFGNSIQNACWARAGVRTTLSTFGHHCSRRGQRHNIPQLRQFVREDIDDAAHFYKMISSRCYQKTLSPTYVGEGIVEPLMQTATAIFRVSVSTGRIRENTQ